MSQDKSSGSNNAGAPAWLTELAEQLDSVIQEDPQKRSAGKLIIRTLIRKAVGGDLGAIKECMSLARRRQPGVGAKPVRRGRGRPAVRIDLEAVERYARLGMRDLSKIARVLGVAKQTLLGPKYGPAVREAFETGRAWFEQDALTEYTEAIAQNRSNPLLIFKLKQLGWTEKVQVLPSGGSNDSAVATMSDEELGKLLAQATRTLERERQEKAASEAPGSPDGKIPPLPPAPVERTLTAVKTGPSAKDEA